jgi:hypothetical protein
MCHAQDLNVLYFVFMVKVFLVDFQYSHFEGFFSHLLRSWIQLRKIKLPSFHQQTTMIFSSKNQKDYKIIEPMKTDVGTLC